MSTAAVPGAPGGAPLSNPTSPKPYLPQTFLQPIVLGVLRPTAALHCPPSCSRP